MAQKEEFNPDDAVVYTIASALAYCPPERVMNGTCKLATSLAQSNGLEPIYAFQNNKTVNNIAFNILERVGKDEIIVAFSGTTNVEQLLLEVAESFGVDYIIHPELKGAKVVRYFYSYYMKHFRDELESAIKTHIKKHTKDRIVFTGHSLGGALSVHGAIDAILSDWIDQDRISVYTFGQPRVGNKVFSDALNTGTRGVYRVIHNKDMVAHIPPCAPKMDFKSCHERGIIFFNNYHASTEVWFEENMENYKVCNTTIGEDPN